mmetsp:Transcript_35838/g.52360  ORF Transcript_35838/g.52360 Transcript_35838/m.52360 type:complete len:402 (-) Transcript_35838:606-1811(-)
MPKGQTQTQTRTFGGKGGVWLKKKKRRIVTEPTDDPRDDSLSSESSEDIPKDLSLNVATRINFNGDACEIENERTSASARLVGWDDVLCRPIYQSAPESDSLVDVNDELIVTPESFAKCEDDAVDGSMNDLAEKGQSSGPVRCRAGRSYGKRKHSKLGLSAAAEEVLHRNRSSHPPPMNMPCKRKPAVEEEDDSSKEFSPSATSVTLSTSPSSGESSPEQQNHYASICSFPESPAEEGPKETELSTAVLSNELAVDSENMIGKKNSKRKSFGRKSSIKMPDLPDLGCQNNEPLRQPSFNTSLSSAKAFFENLDTTEQLSIDNKESLNESNSRCIRTTWRANIDCPLLRESYDEYCKATMLSGVHPISLKEYANNRAHFQHAQNLEDGFLDVALSPKSTSRS